MAKERVFTYRNTGTESSPVWEKWFQKTVADAVLMSDSDSEERTIVVPKNTKKMASSSPIKYTMFIYVDPFSYIPSPAGGAGQRRSITETSR